MNIREKLQNIQCEMKAPKNLYNSFGKYKYRNAESICEAVKPFLAKHKVSLVLNDEVLLIGTRFYIRATASLMDCEGDGEAVSVSALAREADEKKGMDESQISGTASSYARKYALNGLFLLDDTKDADSDEYVEQTTGKKAEAKQEQKPEEKKAEAKQEQKPEEKKSEVKREAYKPATISPEQKVVLLKELNRTGMGMDALLKWAKVQTVDDMTVAQFEKTCGQLKTFPNKENK